MLTNLTLKTKCGQHFYTKNQNVDKFDIKNQIWTNKKNAFLMIDNVMDPRVRFLKKKKKCYGSIIIDGYWFAG